MRRDIHLDAVRDVILTQNRIFVAFDAKIIHEAHLSLIFRECETAFVAKLTPHFFFEIRFLDSKWVQMYVFDEILQVFLAVYMFAFACALKTKVPEWLYFLLSCMPYVMPTFLGIVRCHLLFFQPCRYVNGSA